MNRKIELFKSLWREKPLFRVYLILIILIPIPVLLVSVSIFIRLPAIKKSYESNEVLCVALGRN